jgi:myo-inositol-1(or 4)-monophosphatase
MPTPRQLLANLLPYLKVASGYAAQIQANIVGHPDKYNSDNFFATALTDADLSIQTFIEVVLLSQYPQIRFYGEEYQSTYNTKYFRAIDLGEQGDYLITLDPIDGTRFYMDGKANYQIILTILNADGFEAVITMNPAHKTYAYALRGEGAFVGTFEDDLEQCQPLRVQQPKSVVLMGWDTGAWADAVRKYYPVIDVKADYSPEKETPNVNGLFSGELMGCILMRGKFIDGAALAFMAQEMGYIVTGHDGSALPPLSACQNYQWPGLVIAANQAVHQNLLKALQEVV